MKIISHLLLGCVLLNITGCAIYPLPEDTTGINTVLIVNHIRCEARIAINSAISKYLHKESEVRQDQDILALAQRLEGGEIYDYRRRYPIPKDVSDIIGKYMSADITYDFTFDMTETNNFGIAASFLGVVTGGTITEALSASNNLMRENNRNFFISDDFGKLLTSAQMQKFCRRYAPVINFEYPISGTIGLEQPIETFVNLNEFEDLSAKVGSTSPAPVMADTLKFTTDVSASIGSSSGYVANAKHAALQSLGVTPAVDRKDIHQVIVALALPPPKTAGKPKTGDVATPGLSGKSPAADRAIAEINRQYQLRFLNSVVILAPGF